MAPIALGSEVLIFAPAAARVNSPDKASWFGLAADTSCGTFRNRPPLKGANGCQRLTARSPKGSLPGSAKSGPKRAAKSPSTPGGFALSPERAGALRRTHRGEA